MVKKRKHVQYNEQFKKSAVAKFIEGGQSVNATCKALGIARSTLNKWIKLYPPKLTAPTTPETLIEVKTAVKKSTPPTQAMASAPAKSTTTPVVTATEPKPIIAPEPVMQESELDRLRQELIKITEERDTLKRTIGIISR